MNVQHGAEPGNQRMRLKHAEINELRSKLQEQQAMVQALWGALSSAGAALGVIGSPDGRRVQPVPSLSQPFLQQEVEGGALQRGKSLQPRRA